MTTALALLLVGQISVLCFVSTSAKSSKISQKEPKSEAKTVEPGRSKSCESGDCHNGNGVYAFPNGDKYEGAFRDNQPHGWGVATSKDGLRHEGDFVSSARTGRARVKYPDGGSFEGTFENDRMHGSGILVSPDGNQFRGEFKDGKHHGRGVYAYASGALYQGEYEGGQRHGLGVYGFPDGWRYEGEYRRGQRHGKGVLVTPDGHRYEGEFRSGVKNAFGVYTSEDGMRYEGEFFKDEIEGCGVLLLPGERMEDGSQYPSKELEGRFETGKFTGRGCEGCCRSQARKARKMAEAANQIAQNAYAEGGKALIVAAEAGKLMRSASGEL